MFKVGELVVHKSPLGFAMEFGIIRWIEGNEAGVVYTLDDSDDFDSGGDVFALEHIKKDKIGSLLYV